MRTSVNTVSVQPKLNLHADNRFGAYVRRLVQSHLWARTDATLTAAKAAEAKAQNVASAPSPKLVRLIQWGLLILVALMPFHAFLSVWLGSLTGHEGVIQAWKEVLSAGLVVLAAVLIIREPARLSRLRQPVNYAAGAFIVIGLIVTVFAHPGLSAVIYGIKTDFEFLVLFVLAQLVLDELWLKRLVQIVLGTSLVVAGFAIILAYVLPHNFLAHFGYGIATILPYQNVAPNISAIRVPSTLGGPNQLGSFLILPLALLVWRMCRRPRPWHVPAMLVLLLGLWVTYSRSAIIGAVLAVIVVIIAALPLKRALIVLGAAVIIGLGAGTAIIAATHTESKVQYYVLHAAAVTADHNNSTAEHQEALDAGLSQSEKHPLGTGLGSAGPASFHSDAAFIPEDYYLQLAVETGWLGLVAFVAITALLSIKVWLRRITYAAPALLGALIGNSAVNLFLHGWADSSTAFIFWILAGAVVALSIERGSHVASN